MAFAQSQPMLLLRVRVQVHALNFLEKLYFSESGKIVCVYLFSSHMYTHMHIYNIYIMFIYTIDFICMCTHTHTHTYIYIFFFFFNRASTKLWW